MAAKLSPGGQLLRSSRMFSLPKPLPNAPNDHGNRHPELGTSPFPTHQSIATFEKSRSRGDWGLKRPLPLQTTGRASTPSVRVRHIDSVERITDYAPSTEHSITLQKFQELGIPLTIPALPNSYRSLSVEGVSVFEEDADFISTSPVQGKPGKDKRWKFDGPWLAGMTEGEFNKYVSRTVRTRRHEFRNFLRTRLAADLTTAAQQQALEKATEPPAPVQAEDITEAQLTEYTRRLRSDRVALFALVSEFLDLAPLNPPSAMSSMSVGARVQSKSPNPYAERGPPLTHPSAGLSYLRTDAHTENHPIYGPQAHKEPSLARIIAPRVFSYPAKLGLGGFITKTPQGDSGFNTRTFRHNRPRVAGVAIFDPEIKGGAKAYVQPRTASVNISGKVIIKVDEANEEAQMIAKESAGQAEIYNNKEGQVLGTPQSATTRNTPFGRRSSGSQRIVRGSSQTYGLDR